MKKPKTNLYALLIGINEYEGAPLKGCVKDSIEMCNFIKSDLFSDEYHIHIKCLQEEAATRTAIISCWEHHLGKAKKGDVVLFYFSGHGAQEKADPSIWKEEGDSQLEGLVCYDSLQTNLLLADKELRFLINEVAKNDSPHMVTIFDCCHSGENTRDYNLLDTVTKELAYSKMDNSFPVRKWEDFYFHDRVDSHQLKDASVTLNTVMPQGNHIQLTACQSNQSAYETVISKEWGRGGIFTYTLIDVLKRSRGAVTYYDLKSRIFHYIKNRYRQSPTIYVRGDNSQEIYKTFLGRAQHSQPLYGNLIFNKKREKWILDLGAIHGISKQAKTVSIKGNDKEEVGTILTVHASYTEIEPNSDLPIGEYQAFISSFKSAPIGVFLNGDTNNQATTLKALIEEKGTNINLVAEQAQADYTVQFGEKFCSITLPFDPYRPLVLPIKNTEQKVAITTFNHLYHISQWEFIKLLHNTDTNSQLLPDALKIDFFDKDKELIAIENDQVIRSLSTPHEQGKMQIRLTNTSKRTLHVAVLYLGTNFEASPELLETRVQVLNENDFVWLGFPDNDNWIPYVLDASRHIFNWKENTTYLKFIISTHPFSVDNLELYLLPDPKGLIERSDDTIKGINIRPISTKSEKWTTRLLAFTVPSPSYNQININDLKDKLHSSGATFFAGLYLEEGSDVKDFKVKKDIQLSNPVSS